MKKLVIAFTLCGLLGGALGVASAQEPPPPQQPVAAQELLEPPALQQLVAPIALYPDPVLAKIFMASTYPLEVVQADRWIIKNAALKGDQLKAAVDKQNWDDSIKSLVATPSVLQMMSSKLDWTQKLGDAVLAQQTDVMDAVQRLRAQAQENNQLASTKEQNVTVRQEQNRQIVAIEPAAPDMIYVPYYDPAVVYGSWPYAAYPPYYFPPPPYLGAGILRTGIAFGVGFAVGRWASGGNYWGGGVNWGGNTLNVNRPVNINNASNKWQHNPAHRQGVRNNNANAQQRIGSGSKANARASRGANNRPAARSPGAGSRPAAATRPSSGGARSAGGAPRRDGAAGNRQHGNAARGSAGRARASAGAGTGRGGGAMASRGGGARSGGSLASRGGGGRSAGGGGRGGGRSGGGGRRSDMNLKHDIALLGHLENGIGLYRFVYNGGHTAYVGVIAQEVQRVVPEAVATDASGYLVVFYDRLGIRLQGFDRWLASGAKLPETQAP